MVVVVLQFPGTVYNRYHTFEIQNVFRSGPSEVTGGQNGLDDEIDEPAFTCNTSLDEHSFAYGRGQPRPTYPDLYPWTTPPMQFHGHSNG